jgi:beta-mannosidase
VASWSSIDYHGRWKALHHFATRFFAPLLGSLVLDGDRLTAWVASDLPAPLSVSGSLEVFTWSGDRVARHPLSAKLKPGESRALRDFSVPELLGRHNPRDLCAFIRLAGGGQTTHNFAPFVPWKWTRLPAPKLNGTLRQTSRGLELAVKSPQVIPFLHAELTALEGHFAGDWQITPPGTHVLRWVPHTHLAAAAAPTLAEARRQLNIGSLYDTYAHE